MVPLDLHVLGTPPAFVLSQDQTLHYRVVLIAQYCWRIAVRRRTIRFDLFALISKLCAGRFARPLLFVDVLLFSFQGSVLKYWSGWGESNPHHQLGRLRFYH